MQNRYFVPHRTEKNGELRLLRRDFHVDEPECVGYNKIQTMYTKCKRGTI